MHRILERLLRRPARSSSPAATSATRPIWDPLRVGSMPRYRSGMYSGEYQAIDRIPGARAVYDWLGFGAGTVKHLGRMTPFREACAAAVRAFDSGQDCPQWAANLVIALVKEHETAADLLAHKVALDAHGNARATVHLRESVLPLGPSS